MYGAKVLNKSAKGSGAVETCRGAVMSHFGKLNKSALRLKASLDKGKKGIFLHAGISFKYSTSRAVKVWPRKCCIKIRMLFDSPGRKQNYTARLYCPGQWPLIRLHVGKILLTSAQGPKTTGWTKFYTKNIPTFTMVSSICNNFLYNTEGNVLLMKYNEILNINIHWFKINLSNKQSTE